MQGRWNVPGLKQLGHVASGYDTAPTDAGKGIARAVSAAAGAVAGGSATTGALGSFDDQWRSKLTTHASALDAVAMNLVRTADVVGSTDGTSAGAFGPAPTGV